MTWAKKRPSIKIQFQKNKRLLPEVIFRGLLVGILKLFLLATFSHRRLIFHKYNSLKCTYFLPRIGLKYSAGVMIVELTMGS